MPSAKPPAPPVRRKPKASTLRPRVRIEDPRDIRALAHPARLAVLDELFGGRELTATECAAIAGLSPSAMSYHLRALERAGIVERATSSDGRERPWRAAGSGIEVHGSSDSPLASAATGLLATTVLERSMHQLNAWMSTMDQEDERWREVSGISNARLWLTVAEAETVAQQISDLIESYRGRAEGKRPKGARQMRLGFLFFPMGGAVDESG